MPIFNYANHSLNLKIVYYGPALCGKTTNLLYLHKTAPESSKGEMSVLNTEADRTLFFDLLPMDIGMRKGFRVKLHLYTVPGQVFYDATRRLVLGGADGVVFVADSQREMLEANQEGLKNLKENLNKHGMDFETTPVIFQWNKRDLDPELIASVDELEDALNPGRLHLSFEASALKGNGVFETLKAIGKRVVEDLDAHDSKWR